MAKPVSPRGLARERVLAAALTLFAEHGVHGTSLKMIADHIGVTKAAVYYQFQSKTEIVLEAMRPTLEDMARVIRIADALPDWEARRAVVISGLVEMVVRHRQLVVMFHGDPAIDQMALTQPELKAVTDRLRELLEGPEPDSASRIAFAVFFVGVGKAASDPLLADIEDAEMRRVLLDLSNRIMQPAHEDA
ncbi:AcrR family transcriptional regulator [Mycobacterium sp. MAA66]|uniref:TetR/AcrR family transcriptional regulator n=1 Tax=Mycobacterium sp. MAA66 TaxID=3156297 RepID=UPI0035118C88